MADDIIPLLGGEPILGDPNRLTAQLFIGSPAQADQWLGNAPGTTRYGVCQFGPAIVLAGYLTGPDIPTVTAAEQQLAALAGSEPCRAVLPTAALSQRPQWKWDAWEGCRFDAPSLVWDPNGITTGPAGTPQLAYRLLLRTTGPVISAGAWRPPQAGIMQPQPNGSTWRILNPPFEPDQHV